MSFKDISYLQLWQPVCSRERKHLCNFSRGYHEEQFCEIIFELRHGVQQEIAYNYFLSGALAALMFSGVESFV